MYPNSTVVVVAQPIAQTVQSFDSLTGHSVALSDPILKNEWTSRAAQLDGAVPANAGVPGNGLPDQYNASKNDECHELDKLGSTQVSSYSQTSNDQIAGFACRTIRLHCPHSSHSWHSFIQDTELSVA